MVANGFHKKTSLSLSICARSKLSL